MNLEELSDDALREKIIPILEIYRKAKIAELMGKIEELKQETYPALLSKMVGAGFYSENERPLVIEAIKDIRGNMFD